MLPLRLLVLPYESLSLSERAQGLVLALVAADLATRLLGPGDNRASGALVWQRLVIEEALLRQVIGGEEAVLLMRASLADDGTDPRLDAFLSRWGEPRRAAPPAPPARSLTLVEGGARRRSRSSAGRASRP